MTEKLSLIGLPIILNIGLPPYEVKPKKKINCLGEEIIIKCEVGVAVYAELIRRFRNVDELGDELE